PVGLPSTNSCRSVRSPRSACSFRPNDRRFCLASTTRVAVPDGRRRVRPGPDVSEDLHAPSLVHSARRRTHDKRFTTGFIALILSLTSLSSGHAQSTNPPTPTTHIL